MHLEKLLAKRVDKIIEEIEKSNECKEVNSRIKRYFSEIKKYLPEEKKLLTVRIDDCITEMLVIYQKLYENGLMDGMSIDQFKVISNSSPISCLRNGSKQLQ
ncbi:MAG: hypothetical protein N2645_15415 [Clostridia bacterium]|nr:hypothetical protein [Clostridia bacterium]